MTDIKRDRWDRPLILPHPGADKPVPYTRVSTLAKSLKDSGGLIPWNQRLTALGLAARPDLQLQVQGVMALHDDPLNQATRELDRIIKAAREQAGASAAAETGTAYHALVEALFKGRELPASLPDDARSHVHAIAECIDNAGYDVVESEMFVVNDQVQAAGTFDFLLRDRERGFTIVGDLKTGKSDPKYPLAPAVQIATYANGERYDPDTGERYPISLNLNASTGLLLHAPAKAGGAYPYLLDLDRGWSAALVAAKVGNIRKMKVGDLCTSI